MGFSDDPSVREKHNGIIFPAPLKKGDKVAFISPASAVKKEYIEGAMERFREEGYEPVLMPGALYHERGSFSAPKEERLEDLVNSLADPEIKAIFCNRGGYGCVQLLPHFTSNMISSHPKWIIGFSDVSALLAMWYRSGVASIHGPMAKHLATNPADDPSSRALFNILENGGNFSYRIPSSEYNRPGFEEGILRGGNFAVLNGLAATPFDILRTDPGEQVILFFEDVNEPIYAVERMLWRLCLSGTLSRVKGLIFGRFTDYRPDKNFNSVEEMISFWLDRMLKRPIPVVFNFPTGHVDENYPLVEGAHIELEVAREFVSLKTI